jgi:tetratricopeptide (TPR) repeat protein
VEDSRVVRTRVPIGEDLWSFGSGYLVTPGRVLTARHVLADHDQQPQVGQSCQVRRYPCLDGQPWCEGTIVWLHPLADAAIISVEGMGVGITPVQWGDVDGAEPLGWTATGYPLAGLNDTGRTEEGVYGRFSPTTGSSIGELQLTVESRIARPLPESESGWAGLSGAAVFNGKHLIGIITTDPAQWAKALDGIRSSALIDDPNLSVWIGAPVELESVGRSDETPAGGLRVVGERVSVLVESRWQDRDELRAELRACLLSGTESERILNVTGHRGVGKSATVAKVVSEFERPDLARSPLDDLDALVYLSTRTGDKLASLASIFESLTQLLPEPLATRLTADWDRSHAAAFPLLWDALKARRCVVILDNLDDLQNPDTGELLDPELLTFIESVCRTPYPPRLVCTSQRALALPAELLAQVREFPIDAGLDGVHAIALLRSLVSKKVSLDQYSDDVLERATQRLSGLPHGVELLAQLLAKQPMTLPDLLESDATLDELIAELVSQAFVGLDDAGRWVVELLAMAEVPLPDREIPGLLDGVVQTDLARSSLRALVGSRAVAWDAPSRRVRLHPVDADWVRHDLGKHDPSKQVGLDRRLADWYAQQRTPPDSWRALADVSPHRLEFHHRWRAGDYAEAVSVLVEAAEFLSRKGESAALASAVAEAESVVLDGQARVDLERCRYAVEYFAGSQERAEAALSAALTAARAAGLDEIAAEVEVDLATVQRYRGDGAGAAQLLQSVLARNDATLTQELRLQVLFELGLCYCYLKDWTAAEDVATDLEDLLRPDDARASHAAPSDIRALSRLGAGDYPGALAAADDAIVKYLDSPNQDNVGYLYNVRGLVGLESGDLGQAETELRKGVGLAAQYRIDRLEGICAINLAWALLRASRWTEALDAARLASSRLSSTGVGEAAAAAALEEVLADTAGKAQAVEEYLRRAIDSSLLNSDLYNPTSSVLADLTAALSDRPRP